MEQPPIHPAYLVRMLAEVTALLLVMSKLTWAQGMPWWVLWSPFLLPLAAVAFLGFLTVVRPRGGPHDPPEDEPEEPHDPNDDKPRLTSS